MTADETTVPSDAAKLAVRPHLLISRISAACTFTAVVPREPGRYDGSRESERMCRMCGRKKDALPGRTTKLT
jgi:hypothetical protein